MYDDHLRLIGKRAADFLALIELFSLSVTAEALRAIELFSLGVTAEALRQFSHK